jgi:hypothetical protein
MAANGSDLVTADSSREDRIQRISFPCLFGCTPPIDFSHQPLKACMDGGKSKCTQTNFGVYEHTQPASYPCWVPLESRSYPIAACNKQSYRQHAYGGMRFVTNLFFARKHIGLVWLARYQSANSVFLSHHFSISHQLLISQ